MLKRIAPFAIAFAPVLAFAQTAASGPGTFGYILQTIGGYINILIPLAIAFAVFEFIRGVIKYITSGGEAKGREEARNTIIYGVIGLFAIVSVWGLVRLISKSAGLNDDATFTAPNISNTTNSGFIKQ